VKRLVLFALASAVLIVGLALVLGRFYTSPAEHRAIQISALAAFAVQFATFAMVMFARGTNVFPAWGVGVLLRFGTLAAFAFLVVKGMALPFAPALISLALFFFVTTLVEPVLLIQRSLSERVD
jgi:hypothetical protein